MATDNLVKKGNALSPVEEGSIPPDDSDDSMGVDRTINLDTAIITGMCIVATVILVVVGLWGQF